MSRGSATAFVITHESDPKRSVPATSLIALTLTRSLGRRGIRVIRVHPNRLDDSLTSRYCTGVEVSPDQYAEELRLVDFLCSIAPKYSGPRVLIPASDDTAELLSKHRDVLSGAFEVMAPRPSVMAAIGDKKQQVQAARRLSVPTPETHFPSSHEEVRSLASRIERYPYVIKPIEAHRWRLASEQKIARGRKGIIVNTPAELVEHTEEISEIGTTMIQEVVPGPAENLFTFLGYFSSLSEPIAYCVRSKIRQNPPGLGYCTLTVSCHRSDVSSAAIRMLTELEYYGLVGVEFKLDPRDGLYKLLEINPRAVNTIGIGAGCGVDLPLIAFRDAIGEPTPEQGTWESGVKWLWLAQDLWAARELRGAGRLSMRAWLSSLRGKKVHALLAFDDLSPFLRYYMRFSREIALLAMRRLRR